MQGRFIVGACLGLLCGVAGYYSGHALIAFAGAAIASGFAARTKQAGSLVIIIFGAMACCFGALCYGKYYDAHHASELPDRVFNRQTTIVAVVVDDPDRGSAGTKVVVRPMAIDGERFSESIPDRIIVRMNADATIDYGDRIKLDGVIERPEPFLSDTNREFDYPRYLALRDIVGITRAYDVEIIQTGGGNRIVSALYRAKKLFVEQLGMQYPSPESGFLAGIVIGIKSLLPKDVSNDFQIAGLTHMIVLSGYNITIVATVFAGMFAYLGLGYAPRRIAAMIAIVLFIIMTGLNASAVRAGIMAGLAFVLQMACRPAHTFRIILFTLTSMVIANPRALLWDPSLHLSFLAFIGLCYVAPITSAWVDSWPNPLGITKIFGETLGVQLFVLPYILWMSGRVSALSLLSNILTVPIVPFLMAGGFFSVMAGMLWDPLGGIIATPVTWGLSYILWIAHVVASIDATTFVIPPFGVGYLLMIYWVIGMVLTYKYIHDSLIKNTNHGE